MWFNDKVTVILGKIYILFISIAATEGSTTWKLDPTISNGSTMVGRIKQLQPQGHVPTVSRCIIDCYFVPDCVMVGYMPDLKVCHMYNVTLAQMALLPMNTTVQFYKVKCEDVHNTTECKDWAHQGECESRPGWMTPNCRKSCNKCGQDCTNRIYKHLPAFGMCIKEVKTRYNFTKANNVCHNDGGHLLEIKTAALMDYIFRTVDHSQRYWIGGTRSPNDGNNWHWLSGDIITTNNGGQLWLPGMSGNPTNQCMNTKHEPLGDKFGFAETSCSNSHKFFCQIDI